MKVTKDISIFVKKYIIFFVCLGVAGIVVSLKISQGVSTPLLLLLFFYWALLGILLLFTEKIFFGVSLVFLILSTFPYLSNNFVLAQKLSVWMYMFLLLGLTQGFCKEIFSKKIKK